MKRKNIGRKRTALFLMCGFLVGVCVGRWSVPQQIFAKEMAGNQERLPVVFYNASGQKVCVREGATLSLTEQLEMEIPIEDKKDGWEALVEIRLHDSEGNELSNRVQIRRVLLHDEK